MSCCGHHPAATAFEADQPTAIQPTDPCILCAEKHFETAYVLCAEYGYTDTNRGRAIGELVLCGWHLWKSGHDNLARAVRKIRVLLQLRRDNKIDWHPAATAIRWAAAAEAKRTAEEAK